MGTRQQFDGEQLYAEGEELFALAEQLDERERPDGKVVRDEVARPANRLARLAQAKYNPTDMGYGIDELRIGLLYSGHQREGEGYARTPLPVEGG